MFLTPIQTIIMILAIMAGTMITRFTPFVLFPDNKKPPEAITYLGKVLPPAMMGLLVIYCLKNVNILQGSRGIPELISIGCIILLHKWKNNVLLSIAGSTVVYMVLVQMIFV